jgi:anti-sigma factor RsiW
MKTFEERYTAYLDGLLSESEAAVFEQEQPALAAQRAEWAKLQRVLRKYQLFCVWVDFLLVNS